MEIEELIRIEEKLKFWGAGSISCKANFLVYYLKAVMNLNNILYTFIGQ